MGMGPKRRLLFAALVVFAATLPFGTTAAVAVDDCVEPPAGARVARPGVHEPNHDEAYEEEIERQSRSRAATVGPLVTGGTIPVYVHVIADPNDGEISIAKIGSQIDVLNDAFASTGWTFELQPVVSVTIDTQWARMQPGSPDEQQAKAALREGGAGDLNLYITRPGGGLLGWATFPSGYANKPLKDGVVIHRGTLPGGSLKPYHRGDTAVHEVGHWMGLFHTFQGRCTKAGDLVKDTPRESRPAFGCPKKRDSCPARGRDPVKNYMDYSDDACMNHFTSGQDARMDEQWTQFRA